MNENERSVPHSFNEACSSRKLLFFYIVIWTFWEQEVKKTVIQDLSFTNATNECAAMQFLKGTWALGEVTSTAVSIIASLFYVPLLFWMCSCVFYSDSGILTFSAQQGPFKAGMYFVFTLEFNSELTVTKKQLQDHKAHRRKQYKKINKHGF